MKFTLLWNDTEGAKKSIVDWLEEGRSSDGITLIRADHGSIANEVTGVVSKGAYALRCKGPILSYLNYKRATGKTVWLGWGDPK